MCRCPQGPSASRRSGLQDVHFLSTAAPTKLPLESHPTAAMRTSTRREATERQRPHERHAGGFTAVAARADTPLRIRTVIAHAGAPKFYPASACVLSYHACSRALTAISGYCCVERDASAHLPLRASGVTRACNTFSPVRMQACSHGEIFSGADIRTYVREALQIGFIANTRRRRLRRDIRAAGRERVLSGKAGCT